MFEYFKNLDIYTTPKIVNNNYVLKLPDDIENAIKETNSQDLDIADKIIKDLIKSPHILAWLMANATYPYPSTDTACAIEAGKYYYFVKWDFCENKNPQRPPLYANRRIIRLPYNTWDMTEINKESYQTVLSSKILLPDKPKVY